MYVYMYILTHKMLYITY